MATLCDRSDGEGSGECTRNSGGGSCDGGVGSMKH